jgi:hypothetical protein
MRQIFTATIYGETEEICQDVFYTVKGHIIKPSFFEDGGDLYKITEVELKTPLLIEASDLEQDIETAIRCEWNLTDNDVVRLECKVTLCAEPLEELVNEKPVAI